MDIMESIEELKKEKAKAKGRFTRTKTKLMLVIGTEHATKRQVVELFDSLGDAYANVLEILGELHSAYRVAGEQDKLLKKLSNEMYIIEQDFDEINSEFHRFLRIDAAAEQELYDMNSAKNESEMITREIEELENQIREYDQSFSLYAVSANPHIRDRIHRFETEDQEVQQEQPGKRLPPAYPQVSIDRSRMPNVHVETLPRKLYRCPDSPEASGKPSLVWSQNRENGQQYLPDSDSQPLTLETSRDPIKRTIPRKVFRHADSPEIQKAPSQMVPPSEAHHRPPVPDLYHQELRSILKEPSQVALLHQGYQIPGFLEKSTAVNGNRKGQVAASGTWEKPSQAVAQMDFTQPRLPGQMAENRDGITRPRLPGQMAEDRYNLFGEAQLQQSQKSQMQQFNPAAPEFQSGKQQFTENGTQPGYMYNQLPAAQSTPSQPSVSRDVYVYQPEPTEGNQHAEQCTEPSRILLGAENATSPEAASHVNFSQHHQVYPPHYMNNYPYSTERKKSQQTEGATSDQQSLIQMIQEGQQRNQMLLDVVQLPKSELCTYNGDPLKYWSFINSFDNAVGNKRVDDGAKLTRLLQYCTDRARKVIDCCAIMEPSAGYARARCLLKERFGNEFVITEAWLDRITDRKALKPADAKGLQDFADDLKGCAEVFRSMGKLGEIDTQRSLRRIVDKLPSHLQHRWRKRAVDSADRNGQYPGLQELVNFISSAAREANDPLFGTNTGTTAYNSHDHKDNPKQNNSKTFLSQENGQAAAKWEKRKEIEKGKDEKCPACRKEKHGLWACETFKKMPINQRWDVAKAHHACYRCLGNRPPHEGRTCTRSRECGIDNCKQTHNRLLHRAPKTPLGSSTEGEQREPRSATEGEYQKARAPAPSQEKQRKDRNHASRTMTVEGENSSGYIGLRTVPVIVKSGKRRLKINALLDDASTTTYINTSVAEELGIHGEIKKTTVSVLNGMTETFETAPVELGLESLNKRVDMTITALTTDNVTGDMETVDWSKFTEKFEHLRDIQFPKAGKSKSVDLLIGVDYPELHMSLKEIAGKPSQPMARLTKLGWTCVGCPTGEKRPHSTNFARTFFARDQHMLDEVNNNIKKFWEIENEGIQTDRIETMSLEDKAALKTVQESLEYRDGHYKVQLPWKDGRPKLPDNQSMAIQRLEQTERRLKKTPEAEKAYKETIKKYVEKGYVRKVPKEEIQPDVKWFLPHFPVIRLDKSTTKLRIVFDASAKFEGTSLNNTILQGPKLQREIVDVLLRFRKEPVAVVGDVAEMYLQVRIAEEDRPYHRFLWRDCNTDQEAEEYEFSRVVFGVNSSPFLAQFVSQEHAKKYSQQSPLGAEAIQKSTYMDDSMDSTLNDAMGIKLYQELSQIWKTAGMHCRKWLSNSATVLREIPEDDRAAEIDLEEGQIPSIKTLGILWIAVEDAFSFRLNPPAEDMKMTKRTFLRKLATIFDPLGLLSPYVINGKVLMQEIWVDGQDWDEEISSELNSKAKVWFQDLPVLRDVKIPRCIRLDQHEIMETFQLHTFTDASSEAYGAVIYARTTYQSGRVVIRIVTSKTKVAPLAAVSIPRLEMMGAVIGLRLARTVTAALKISMEKVQFWSDSMNVLYWLRSASRRYKPFIAHRVGEIHLYSNPTQWRHVPTKENPADLLSRGMRSSNLLTCSFWWNGPKFLELPERDWPEDSFKDMKEGNANSSEMKKTARAYIVRQPEASKKPEEHEDVKMEKTGWRLDPERYSSWHRLTRIYAWVQRFISNCLVPETDRKIGELKLEEIQDAETSLISCAQKEAFSAEYKALQQRKQLPISSKILNLHPMFDGDGLMRCQGRLENAEFLSYDARYPVILPRKSRISTLIIKDYHERAHHVAGTNQTLAQLSTRYWIPAGREAIREWEKECSQCRRRKSKPANQIMAPLPRIRLKLPLRAFARTSVDYGGPFLTKQGRGRVRTKRYLCLFTCLLSRALHLEMAYSLDTDSFLNAFSRMTNRRGIPLEMLSDNGTNFISGERELRELVDRFDQEKIVAATSKDRIKWSFNPPLGPHFGGVHEILIKSAKKAIYAILRDADINDEELHTAITGAESLLNSRPLTYQSSDVQDPTPLTPNHLLHGQLGGQVAPEAIDSLASNPRKRWRRVQELLKHFWARWMREWLPMMHPRTKWAREQRDLQVGEIVLVISPDSSRGKWPLGRIIQVNPGGDGHVRVARVQVGSKVMVRPITRLCPLECAKIIPEDKRLSDDDVSTVNQ